ncbi:site-specific integrase [Motiliproteus sp. SC1-56]|uniref:tyrosine-type recombinase/integrase n=1 Tax=Motiliproteus sp. SC1-56 TaxID=2799565 RepID=UPI001A90006E|nr:site-specific integrase [Motiliproteus sp. SC1-56]
MAGDNSNRSARPLSDAAVRRMKAGATLADAGDHRGLRVTRGKRGGTTFYYRYRSPVADPGGQRPIRQYRIGHYPEMSLAEARACHTALKAKRDSGLCPAAEARREAATARESADDQRKGAQLAAFTVEHLVEKYLAEYIEDRTAPNGQLLRRGARAIKGQREARRTLYGDAVRGLGSRPAVSVSSKEVLELIQSIVDRGASVQAGVVLRELTAAFDFAIGDPLPEDFQNPCYQAKGILRRKKLKLTCARGKRVLSDQELSRLLAWLPGSRYTPTQKNVLLFTLMTGCRTGEVCGARWSDIDLENRTWHLRETKSGSERYVQLADQAIDFLVQLRRVTGDCLFPSRKTGQPLQQKQLTEQAWRMRRDRVFIDLPKWTPHDLRRTVRTGLARLGCPSEVAEAILGHARSGIEGTYDLHRYEAECRIWLQRWNDHLDALREK